VGTASSPEDVFAYNLDVQGALQSDLDAGGQAIENAGSVSTGSAEVTDNKLVVSGTDGFNHAINVENGLEVLLRSADGDDDIGLYCNNSGELIATNRAGNEVVLATF
jgi:hypothetical protein